MKIDWSKAVAHEKVDGSLIKVYNHKGRWYVSTRGTAYAESDCMGYGVTFKELVYRALGVADDDEFQVRCRLSDLWHGFTYIFELTSVENRVVKRYEGYKLHYLAARENKSGRYVSDTEKETALRFGAEEIQEYRFDSVEECMNTVKNLKNLDEGYVIYQDGEPICKIKSPAYVACHHIRGEGLNPKRIMQLVLSGEEDEYLTYFPDDAEVMEPYIQAYGVMVIDLRNVYRATKHIEDQKEFAIAVAKSPFKAVLFTARSRGLTYMEAFNAQRDTNQIELLKGFVE